MNNNCPSNYDQQFSKINKNSVGARGLGSSGVNEGEDDLSLLDLSSDTNNDDGTFRFSNARPSNPAARPSKPQIIKGKIQDILPRPSRPGKDL